MTARGLLENLSAGVAELGLPLSEGARVQLLSYLDLIQRWNRTYNLTAIRNPADMLTQHLLDSLAVLPLLGKSALAGRRLHVADVGSGAGLPGIPWAIACPQWQVALIEAVEKKSAFLRQVKIELVLDNVAVLGQRVESVAPAQYDVVVSRAFASLADFIALSGHLVTDAGCLCAMKGVLPEGEMSALPAGWGIESVNEVSVPGLDARRHVLIVRKG